MLSLNKISLIALTSVVLAACGGGGGGGSDAGNPVVSFTASTPLVVGTDSSTGENVVLELVDLKTATITLQ